MAKITQFIKPDLQLPYLPLINMYIVREYSIVQTRSDYVKFINHCFNVAETSLNEIKANAYHTVGSALYAFETNISYESKEIELLVKSL